MAIFGKRKEIRSETTEADEALLRRRLMKTEVSVDNVCEIPAAAACIRLISETIARLPFKLYKRAGDDVSEISEDGRVRLLNDETGDTLSPFQMKASFFSDYLIHGNGYIYINREKNRVRSLHYVPASSVSVLYNPDVIFKKAEILVDGRLYRPFEFLTIARNSVRGLSGKGIVDENSELLNVIYNTLQYEANMVSAGGNKRGYLKSEHKLDEPSIKKLKNAWNNFYGNNEDNVIVLNNGIDFQEAANTVVEMQLNENKQTNSEAVCNIFLIPPKIITGGATDDDRQFLVDNALKPIITAAENTLNQNLLLESEKGSYFFALDTKTLMTGDIEKRFRAFQTALQSNIMRLDEVRGELNLPKTGFNYIKLGLQDVLLDPVTKTIYTPNTNATADLDEIPDKGGDENAERGNKSGE